MSKWKALTIGSDWMLNYVSGSKSIECRTWQTDYRGDIILCSNAKRARGTMPGHALMIANLVDIQTFSKKLHLKGSDMFASDVPPKAFAWLFDNFRFIQPIPVKGKLSLWELDAEPIVLDWMSFDYPLTDKQYANLYGCITV